MRNFAYFRFKRIHQFLQFWTDLFNNNMSLMLLGVAVDDVNIVAKRKILLIHIHELVM